MRKTILKKTLSFIVCTVLIAAEALFTTGCNANNTNSSGNMTSTASAAQSDITVLGQGATQFTFKVTDADGNEAEYQINTDKITVGEALTELGLIAGEESEYGLYVKTVNGVTIDYETDGKYWAFYIDDEYAQTGVDSTDITAGSVYSFKAE